MHKRSKNTSQDESKSFKYDKDFTRHESNVHYTNTGEQLPSSLLGLKFDIICYYMMCNNCEDWLIFPARPNLTGVIASLIFLPQLKMLNDQGDLLSLDNVTGMISLKSLSFLVRSLDIYKTNCNAS